MDGSPLHREVLAPSIEVLQRLQVNTPCALDGQTGSDYLTNCASF